MPSCFSSTLPCITHPIQPLSMTIITSIGCSFGSIQGVRFTVWSQTWLSNRVSRIYLLASINPLFRTWFKYSLQRFNDGRSQSFNSIPSIMADTLNLTCTYLFFCYFLISSHPGSSYYFGVALMIWGVHTFPPGILIWVQIFLIHTHIFGIQSHFTLVVTVAQAYPLFPIQSSPVFPYIPLPSFLVSASFQYPLPFSCLQAVWLLCSNRLWSFYSPQALSLSLILFASVNSSSFEHLVFRCWAPLLTL